MIIKILNKIKSILLNPRLGLSLICYESKKIFYDIIFLFKKKHKFNIIFIAGMPMSATTKVKNMCGMIPYYFTRYTPMPYSIAVNQNISDSAFNFTPKRSYSIFKTHLNPDFQNIDIIQRNDVKKVVVTYRDLRDVVISRYHRLMKFPKKKGDPNYSEYHLMNKSDAIDHSIKVVSSEFIRWINGWFDTANNHKDFVLFIKFEELVNNPENEFRKILNFYEINLDEILIKKICKSTEGKKNMTTNMNEAKVLPWAISSNFRSGKIGYWKNEFTKENVINAKVLLGKALIDLEYEKNLNWKI
jgi:hypothetical protein